MTISDPHSPPKNTPSSARRQEDPVWQEALDWLMRVQATPDDPGVLLQRDLWRQTSPAHARAYLRAERVWQLSGDVQPATPIHPPSRLCSRQAMTHHRVRTVLAACLALFLLLPLLSSPIWSDYRTGTAERRHLVLADSSTIDLDADSAVDVALTDTGRDITLLAGRAYFQVTPDASRPFTVTAGDTTVTVTGTAFDVHADGGPGRGAGIGTGTDPGTGVSVEVASGAVTVTTRTSPRSWSLKPGDRALSARGALTVSTIPPEQVGLWRADRLVVRGAPVSAVIDDLRRHTSAFILLTDRSLASRQVTGVFDTSDPMAALSAVIGPHGGRIRQIAPGVLLVSGH